MAWWTSDGVRAFALSLIRSYVYTTGRSVFSYRDLRIYYYGQYADHTYDWHSIERAIRRLAQEGLLHRIRAGKHVLFSLTDAGMQLSEQLGWAAA